VSAKAKLECDAFVLCTSVVPHFGGGLSIIEIANSLETQLPQPAPPLLLVAFFTSSEKSSVPLTIRWLAPDMAEFGIHETVLEFDGDPVERNVLVLNINTMSSDRRLEQPGIYQFEALIEGDRIARTVLKVSLPS
jgi:Family of unknown function (DUF6941)